MLLSVAEHTLQLLEQLEGSLKQNALWMPTAPSPAALQSKLPFATDTLEFHQWLQFIMIPNLRQRIALEQPLPNKISVYPMAVEVWRGKLREHHAILLTLKNLDKLLDGHHE